MINTYIKDKLLEKHICRFNDGECNCDCYIAGMTDYHNHIVEKIENQKEIFGMSDFQNETQFNRKQKHNDIIYKVLSSLQDTNPKE